MVAISMDWNELKRRAKNGTSLTNLAELNGVTPEVLKQAITELEKQTGEKLVFEKPEKKKKEPLKKRIDKHEVLNLANQGKNGCEIATILGCSLPPVYKILKEWRAENEPKQEERPPMTLNPEFWEKLAGRKEEADAAMVDLIVEQIFSLEEQIEQIERQAAPLRYQLDKWKKIKEALENDTL